MRFCLLILGFPKLPMQSLGDYCNSLTILVDTLCEQHKVILNLRLHFSYICQYGFYSFILIQNLHLKNHWETSISIYGEVLKQIMVHCRMGYSATIRKNEKPLCILTYKDIYVYVESKKGRVQNTAYIYSMLPSV